jgi:hypothetical protein
MRATPAFEATASIVKLASPAVIELRAAERILARVSSIAAERRPRV